MPEVLLTLGGRAFEGWLGVRLTRSLEALAHTFTLTVTDRWAESDGPRPVKPGEACQLIVDGETALTGYVDAVGIDYDAETHRITVSGRSRTADLVDCSAVHKPGQWKGQNLVAVARDLCRPFGVAVRAEVHPGETFASFGLQEGETVYEALERGARMRGLMLTTDGDGALVITRTGRGRLDTALKWGSNILSARLNRHVDERFSEYVAKGQSAGSDDWFGEQAAAPAARVQDPQMGRHRPLVLMAEGEATPAELEQRATWERNVRAGRAERVTYRVVGHQHRGGRLWAPNVLVPVEDALSGIEDELLLVSTTLTIDREGTTSELSLTRPEAFEVGPPPKQLDVQQSGSILDDVRGWVKDAADRLAGDEDEEEAA